MYARAIRTAIIVASVPELWNRTFSEHGISSCTSWPHWISSSVDAA